MSMLPWDGIYSAGTKRGLAWEPAGQPAPKLRYTRPPAETASLFHGDDDGGRGNPASEAALFHGDDDGRRGNPTYVLIMVCFLSFIATADEIAVDTERGMRARGSVARVHDYHGTVLRISELSSQALNGSVLFAKWLVQNRSILDGGRVLELKSGTGALAIFLRKVLGTDITTSDDDKEIEYNVAYNCRINNLAVLPHIQYTWGDPFPVSRPDWDIVIACDIEPYVDQSPDLVKTLSFLLREYKQRDQRVGSTTITSKSGTQVPVNFPIFLISWRRRIDPSVLFLGCENEGLEVQHLGYLVYLIKKKN